MALTPLSDRFDKRLSREGNIVKAFGSVKHWLNSNPPTPTSAPFIQKSEAEDEGPAIQGVIPNTEELATSLPEELPSLRFSSTQPYKSASSRVSWSVSGEENLDDEDRVDERLEALSDSSENPVKKWLGLVEKSPLFLKPISSSELLDGYKQDIDTLSGELASEIKYPETLPDRYLGMCRDASDIAWRQANMSTELQIRREISSREKLSQQLRLHMQAEPLVSTYEEEEDSSFPKADCKLRPAMPEDFEDIAKIINLERNNKSCPQIVEKEEVKATDIKKLYDLCRNSYRPFIVATPKEDELWDRAKWPKNADKAYQDWVKFKKLQPSSSLGIYGFAFVADARLGFMGISNPASDFTGQIRLVVHPSYRSKLYGSALLDRILLSTAPYHQARLNYKWECPTPEHVYENVLGYNRRQYALLFIEIFCAGKEDTEFVWRKGMLEKYGFQQSAHFGKAIRSNSIGSTQWLDLSLWSFNAQNRAHIVEHSG